MSGHAFEYRWNLKDSHFTKDRGRVFSCFACGGGRNQGDANLRLFGKDSNFNQVYVYRGKVCPTLSAKDTCLMHFEAPLYLSRGEVCSVSTFPQDYDFGNESPHYICGMSVPPVMMAQVASRVYQQWLKPINEQ